MQRFQKMKNNIRVKLKLEKFIKEEVWQLLLVIAFLFLCGWLFDKIIISVLFAIAHTGIRPKFEKQFHAKKTYLCMVLTLTISFFGIASCLPLTVSLLSVIPICWFISWVGYIAQDRMDCYKIITKLQSKTIWQMTENELVDYCYAKGIRGDMLEFVVMIVVHQMKYEDIGKLLRYSVDTLKDWSPICKNKLGITSWKQHKN